eukprot:361894-Chlamydomonas_euryale.AAC.5
MPAPDPKKLTPGCPHPPSGPHLKVRVVRRLARLGRIHHERDADLPAERRAQVNRNQLGDLRLDLGTESGQLHVPTAPAALAGEALRDGVQRHERHGVEQPHAGRDLFERRKRLALGIHVGLIDLVCNAHEALVLAELHHLALIVVAEALAGWVARVDDH